MYTMQLQLHAITATACNNFKTAVQLAVTSATMCNAHNHCNCIQQLLHATITTACNHYNCIQRLPGKYNHAVKLAATSSNNQCNCMQPACMHACNCMQPVTGCNLCNCRHTMQLHVCMQLQATSATGCNLHN